MSAEGEEGETQIAVPVLPSFWSVANNEAAMITDPDVFDAREDGVF